MAISIPKHLRDREQQTKGIELSSYEDVESRAEVTYEDGGWRNVVQVSSEN